MKAEERFKDVVRLLVATSRYPSPDEIRRALGRYRRRAEGGNVLNGRETRWRAEVLTELGWTHRGDSLRSPRRARRQWVPPALVERVEL